MIVGVTRSSRASEMSEKDGIYNGHVGLWINMFSFRGKQPRAPISAKKELQLLHLIHTFCFVAHADNSLGPRGNRYDFHQLLSVCLVCLSDLHLQNRCSYDHQT